ncbi:MAG: dienelactone hydrolase family protein [Anaerolineales bacterium]
MRERGTFKPFFKEVCDLPSRDSPRSRLTCGTVKLRKTIDGAKGLMEKSDGQLVGDTVMAAKDHLRGLVNGKIGLVGFSMGGAWALITAAYKPEQIAAAVLFLRQRRRRIWKGRRQSDGALQRPRRMGAERRMRRTPSRSSKSGRTSRLSLLPEVAHWFVESDRP